MPHEVFQQTELRGRQGHFLPVQGHAVGFHIQQQGPAAQGRARAGAAAAAQDGPDAQHQFPDAERFDHIVIGPQGQPHDAVHFLAAGREHEHGDGRRDRLGLEPAADIAAVHAGQHEIQHHQIWQLGGRHVQAPQPVGRFQYRKAFALKIEAQQLADIVFVFNNKYALHGTFLCLGEVVPFPCASNAPERLQLCDRAAKSPDSKVSPHLRRGVTFL